MALGVAASLPAVADGVSQRLEFTDYVNPFVGTTNFGTTNPGAVRPNGSDVGDTF